MSKTEPIVPKGYENLLMGEGVYDVIINSKVAREMQKGARKEQLAGLNSLVKTYVVKGPSGLPYKKFNGAEGWFPSKKASNKIRLEAFKPFQLRAYGFCRHYRGRPTFFITGVDVSKKQNDADPIKLKSAGDEAVRLDGTLGE